LELQLYNIIITVIILHELAHVFMKVLKKWSLLCCWCWRFSRIRGEWMACRERFFGGRIEVEWERQENAFNMDLIDRVLLKSKRNHLIF